MKKSIDDLIAEATAEVKSTKKANTDSDDDQPFLERDKHKENYNNIDDDERPPPAVSFPLPKTTRSEVMKHGQSA